MFPNQRDKEFTPRKPVILAKSDRESKEADRSKRVSQLSTTEMAEKEKQPIIMIKAREPSTAKDAENRAQSPKKMLTKENETESSVIPVIKIAQNESKEKKIAENKLLAPPPSMSNPLKLIDEFSEFSLTVAEYLQDTNTNFLVVGIIGNQSVGKSTVMNILAHTSDFCSLREGVLRSHEFQEESTLSSSSLKYNDVLSSPTPTDKITQSVNAMKIINNTNIFEESKLKPLVFKCQNTEQIEAGQACTSGVDIYVTESRIILLDTGPVYGAGARSMMTSTGYCTLPRGGLEISAFLLAVCHVVILVQDWFVDINMLRFLQSAEMVKPSIPAASNVNQNMSHSTATAGASLNQDGDSNFSKDHYPHLLFLQNKCTMDDFKPQSIKLMQDLYKKAFARSKLNIESGIYLYDPESDDNSQQIDSIFHNLNAEQCGKPINLFLMPTISDEDGKNTYRGHPTFEELSQRLRWLIFGAARNQLTNVQLNERTWLQYCNKTWDNVKKSTFFIEYNRLLQ